MPSTLAEMLLQEALTEMPLILSLIFGGCCSNVFALEVLVTDAPKSGHLITLGQFVFVAIEGARHHFVWSKFGPKLKPTVVPMTRWLFLVIMFFLVSVLNNLALGYNISMPLHIIFRSGGLIINMILGAIILKKRYSISQIIGVLLVTTGVILATLDNAKAHTENNPGSTPELLTGIALLLVAMIISSLMGLFQEVTYKKYGKQWREGLFYTHFLSLPFFLFFYHDLSTQVKAYNNSPLLTIPVLMNQVPVLSQIVQFLPEFFMDVLAKTEVRKLWAFLVLNMITQYVCIAGVNRMTASATSLTLNLVLNLRKFVSLLISIIYFENHFGISAKIGTALVLFGTAIYTRASLKGTKVNTPDQHKSR